MPGNGSLVLKWGGAHISDSGISGLGLRGLLKESRDSVARVTNKIYLFNPIQVLIMTHNLTY